MAQLKLRMDSLRCCVKPKAIFEIFVVLKKILEGIASRSICLRMRGKQYLYWLWERLSSPWSKSFSCLKHSTSPLLSNTSSRLVNFIVSAELYVVPYSHWQSLLQMLIDPVFQIWEDRKWVLLCSFWEWSCYFCSLGSVSICSFIIEMQYLPEAISIDAVFTWHKRPGFRPWVENQRLHWNG